MSAAAKSWVQEVLDVELSKLGLKLADLVELRAEWCELISTQVNYFGDES